MAVIVSKQLKVPSFGRLPRGYVELAYIQSSGTQYINTGFKPNNNTRVVLDVQAIRQEHGKFVFGSLDNWAVNMYGVVMTASGWEDEYGNSYKGITGSPLNRNTIDKNKNTTKVNGTTVATHTSQTLQASYNLLLCCEYYMGSVVNFSSVKVFSCQIYDNGTLIRDYVPCIDPNGSVGLYDLVNERFYTNAGTGAFTGSAVI